MSTNLFRNIEARLTDSMTAERFCAITNLRNRVRGKCHKINPLGGPDSEILLAEDGDEAIHFCRRNRHNRYKRGVRTAIDRLARDYHLDRLADLRGGTFIDCGANVGELGLWAKTRGFDYIPFEPEALEARCVDLNVFDGVETCRRAGLWNKTTTLTLYNRADEADSSFLPGEGGGGNTIELPVTRLDEALDLSQADRPIIFKLEAEGAEPEVLEGARESLRHIDYVAVDCGYERGPEKNHTVVETNTALVDHGFRLIAAQFQRVTALYGRPDRA